MLMDILISDVIESKHPQRSANNATARSPQYRQINRLLRVTTVLLYRPRTVSRRRAVSPNRSIDLLQRGLKSPCYCPGCKSITVSARREGRCASVNTPCSLSFGDADLYSPVISNPRIFYSTQYPSSPPKTQSHGVPRTRTKPTKESLSPGSVLVALVRLRLPISAFQRLFGTRKL